MLPTITAAQDLEADREFARAFERGEIAPAAFHHRDHLRLAWAYLAECDSTEAAGARIAAAIRRFAAAAGVPEKYHETLTLFWVRVLAQARTRTGVAAGIDEALRLEPRLLEKDLPRAYYSRVRLESDEARRCWREPDLEPLP
jgi:hypothetical protein